MLTALLTLKMDGKKLHIRCACQDKAGKTVFDKTYITHELGFKERVKMKALELTPSLFIDEILGKSGSIMKNVQTIIDHKK